MAYLSTIISDNARACLWLATIDQASDYDMLTFHAKFINYMSATDTAESVMNFFARLVRH